MFRQASELCGRVRHAAPASRPWRPWRACTAIVLLVSQAGCWWVGDNPAAPPPPANQAPLVHLTLPTGRLESGVALSFSSLGSLDPEGRLTALRWHFGDGSPIVIQDQPGALVHRYSQAGQYTVWLTAEDERGAVQSATAQLSIVAPNQAPVPALGLPGGPLVAGQALAFDSRGSLDADGRVTELRWTWGDGSPDTVQTGPGPLTHTYAAAGRYTVSLRATDDAGSSRLETALLDVSPANLPPTALLVSSAGSLWVGQTLTLDAGASTDADGRISLYTWDFGDGQRSEGTASRISHRYLNPGSLTARVTVTDDQGAQASATVGVQVRLNQAPVAVLDGPDGSLLAAQALPFDASGSFDPDGRIVRCDWDFGDGQTARTEPCAAVSHPFASANRYLVRLTVTDDQGASGSTSLALNVGAAAPTARLSANLVSPITGQEVRLDPSASSAASGRIVRYDWAFGDGRTAVSQTPEPQHVSWPSAGLRTVSLKVTDSRGISSTATLGVQVASLAPTGRWNDTGMDQCASPVHPGPDWRYPLACAGLDWAGQGWGRGQDAYLGRDALAREARLSKIGTGAAGFDFTRLGAAGLPLAIQDGRYSASGRESDGTRWDCVRDNTTGLIWEVKHPDPAHLRAMVHTYAWFNPDSSSHGGQAGVEASRDSAHPYTGLPASCTGVADSTRCNTHSYTTAVNALPAGQALCGFRDWRLPTADELSGLALIGRGAPAIDVGHFPNTRADDMVWSATPMADDASQAWSVDFYFDGFQLIVPKRWALAVRLVRSGT